MTIRVGIIGCGSIARVRHAPEYFNNPNAEIVAVFDLNLNRAETLASKYGCKVVGSYMDIINDDSIDAISDCSTNEMHHIITSTALLNNKSVLCEKPMAISVENAQIILDAESKSKGILMLDHNQRLTKAHRKVKEILKSGELGKVITFKTSFGHKGPEYWGSDKSKKTWFFNKKRSVLGVAGDLGIHKVDLIRFLLEDDISEVSAMEGNLHKTDDKGNHIGVSDNMICLIKTKNGVLGTASFSWTYYGEEDNSTIIYCEKGEVRIYGDYENQIVINKFGSEIIKYQIEKIQTNDNQTSTGVIDEFIESIVEGRKPAVTGEDGIKALRVIEAAIKSTKLRKNVKV
ncbi:Gfo/Idh/MocA family oxidoreductase [Clostridium sediminicola]|uniref:Gfo/Idh/MocA family protein n=1 Tax=Clostridium sediminicola TaxID=3114879 RepID=UPI0031F21024